MRSVFPQAIAAVIIGRNEGERLVRCLKSVAAVADRVVYVDSGSKDGSVATARSAGAEVVVLDGSIPFTAARARNAGIALLHSTGVAPTYVQFIDGDCELRADWVSTATEFLEAHPQVAIVCGRRCERFPDASVYNALCDWEWNTPIGEAKACGGDSLARLAALDEVGGFNPTLIAGEEPEMCVRLRQKGWKIWRIDAEMTLHDAAMTRFSQWWNRTRRGGYAAAEGMAMHGAAPEYHGVRTVGRALLWGVAIPSVIVLSAILVSPLAWIVSLIYPMQIMRVAARESGTPPALTHATFLTVGKFAEATGVLEYLAGRWTRNDRRIIEYK